MQREIWLVIANNSKAALTRTACLCAALGKSAQRRKQAGPQPEVDSFYLSVVEVLVHVVVDLAGLFCIIVCPCFGDLHAVRHFVEQMVLAAPHDSARKKQAVHKALV